MYSFSVRRALDLEERLIESAASSKRSMNILLVNQYYPPDTAPTGHYLHDLATALVARGHSVSVLCSRRAYNGTERYAASEVLDGVHIRRINATGFGRRHGLGKLIDYASFYALLTGSLLIWPKAEADLLVALTTPPHLGLLVKWAAFWRKATHAHWIMDIYPDVIAAHGFMTPSSLGYRLLARLTRSELRGSPLVLCLGEDMAERLETYINDDKTNPTHLLSLPLWSDPALSPWPEGTTPAFRTEQGWTERDLVLMYSGNMGRGHRLGEFLQAAGQLRADRHLHWVFAGGGKRRYEVEEALRSDPALPVRLLPYAPAHRLREHLCSADVHLASLDAQWQGCMVPSKLQGILAVGKPLILVSGSTNSLARWIKASGGGWVVPENDVAALTAAIEQARDPAERSRRGRAARAFAEKYFDRATNLQRMCELLESCPRPT